MTSVERQSCSAYSPSALDGLYGFYIDTKYKVWGLDTCPDIDNYLDKKKLYDNVVPERICMEFLIHLFQLHRNTKF